MSRKTDANAEVHLAELFKAADAENGVAAPQRAFMPIDVEGDGNCL